MTPLFPSCFLQAFPLRVLCFLFPRVVVSTGNGGNKQGEPRASVEGKLLHGEETNTTRCFLSDPSCCLAVS